MPLGTDLSRLLRKDEPATAQEAEAIRLGLNQLQSQASVLSGLVDAQGNLHHNVFSHKAGYFSQLPHNTSSMFLPETGTPQTIVHNTATVVVFEDDATLSSGEKRFSWENGIRRSISSGEFFLEGIPEETIWQFTAMVYWDDIPDLFLIYVLEKDTATGHVLIYENSTSSLGYSMGTILMRARKASTSWQLQVLQNTGGDASRDIGSALFQVARVR